MSPSLSIRQYGRHVARGVVAADTEDEVADRTPSFWQREIPEPPPDFFRAQVETFDLTRVEAEWLCERIISSDGSGVQASLLSAYVRDLRRGRLPPAVEAVWDAALPDDVPEPISRLVYHAQRFSCAANGASLLYNLMLAEARSQTLEPTYDTSVETYRSMLEQWAAIATRVRLAAWAAQMPDFWDCALGNVIRIPS